MKKVIFLDRDGTINVEKNYLYKISDFEFEKNAINGLLLMKKLGYLLIVITNQSGIARGYYNEEDVNKLHKEVNFYLSENYNFTIDRFYFCPHHLDGVIEKYAINCTCRKPKSKLLKRAVKDYSIDLSNSYLIGDKISDIELGINNSITSFLVETGYGSKTKKILNNKNVIIKKDLFQVAKYIEEIRK